MKKIMEIKGMSCAHCQARVETALNGIEGVKATVDLKTNMATLKISKDVFDSVLSKAVEDAGYKVGAIETKKGLF